MDHFEGERQKRERESGATRSRDLDTSGAEKP
jgi:hypothetical protein